ncbi:MAG: hypothetical protein GY949_18230 [Gammaproteobacteria bacterium]|nr:hypothetical protein [Gammaproteobacteria bacterium]
MRDVTESWFTAARRNAQISGRLGQSFDAQVALANFYAAAGHPNFSFGFFFEPPKLRVLNYSADSFGQDDRN